MSHLARTSPRSAAAVVALGLSGAALAFAPPALASGPATEEERDVLPRSAIEDVVADTASLPLHVGRVGSVDGPVVRYVVTESSRRGDASRRGVNHAPRLAAAAGTEAVQQVDVVDGVVVFPATVDFSPHLRVEPGPTAFPPAVAEPGSVGEAGYSPLVQLPDGTVLNASHVANATGTHDKLLRTEPGRRGVGRGVERGVFRESEGFYEGEEVYYVSFEATDPVIAALENATYAPALAAAPSAGSDDDDSARSAIVPFTNGRTGADDPDRQGLTSALLGEGDPLNVIDSLPENGNDDEYSPLWDVHAAEWTDAAVAAGLDTVQTDVDDIRELVAEGLVTGPGGAPWGPVGVIVNCPVISIES
ncbi:hypothetical protein [Aquipuribacter nitratireducens]|uniref:Serine protease n=1 Tax=Aquipuribacter nitratireducens TaxID=650104 RepID=A0ABW0GR80_9MICO